MNIASLILRTLSEKKVLKVSDLVKMTGFSRTYINRFFKKLQEEGSLVLIGKANQAKYVLAKKKSVFRTKSKIKRAHRVLKNKNLSEDIILDEIKRDTGIFLALPKNIAQILDYAFTEMLNNAIEHSQSARIEIIMKRESAFVRFDIFDWGMGIFSNIMKKRRLKNELEAIQDLIKGKQTTLPKLHSGEGIFFTSKVADTLTFQSSNKKLIFNNILGDLFVRDVKTTSGTKVTFTIGLKSKRDLGTVFRAYSDESFAFDKTKVRVALFKIDVDYISRSQARRILAGLDKFKKIILDFKNVDTVGQAFADEVFRIWKARHPDITIEYQNANENIEFMVKRAFLPPPLKKEKNLKL